MLLSSSLFFLWMIPTKYRCWKVFLVEIRICPLAVTYATSSRQPRKDSLLANLFLFLVVMKPGEDIGG